MQWQTSKLKTRPKAGKEGHRGRTKFERIKRGKMPRAASPRGCVAKTGHIRRRVFLSRIV